MLSGTTKPHLGTSGVQVVFLCSFELRTGTHVLLRTVTARIESRADPPLGYQMGLSPANQSLDPLNFSAFRLCSFPSLTPNSQI